MEPLSYDELLTLVRDLQVQLTALREENRQLREENAQLKVEIERLKGAPPSPPPFVKPSRQAYTLVIPSDLG